MKNTTVFKTLDFIAWLLLLISLISALVVLVSGAWGIYPWIHQFIVESQSIQEKMFMVGAGSALTCLFGIVFIYITYSILKNISRK